jgi:hypothetical protein
VSQLPARIDREAFERILQRASEIQAHGRDVGDSLTEDEVVSLGREVGINEVHLRQALLEEQTRVVAQEPTGSLDRAVGPATVVAERVVQGTPDTIAAALSAWFEEHEVLVVQRRTGAKVTWEPASSFAGTLKRMGWTFSANRSKPFLGKVEHVTALLTPLEEGYCHVTLMAVLRGTRTSYVAGGATLGTAGTVMAGVAVLIGAPLLLLPVAALPSFGAGYLVARLYRPIAERARLGLLRALDNLERQPALPASTARSPRGRNLARDIGDVVREITHEVRKAMEEKA